MLEFTSDDAPATRGRERVLASMSGTALRVVESLPWVFGRYAQEAAAELIRRECEEEDSDGE